MITQELHLPHQRLAPPVYSGRHRGTPRQQAYPAGSLVLEPGAHRPSSVIRRLDDATVLVRHVGTQDDHPAAVADLAPFADGRRVRCAADFGDSG
jgi:hypothetical protein